MRLSTEHYREQEELWPQHGRVILAQFDAESIVVYQAYRPEIGHFAAKHGYFGGEFKLSRMSWIKPNFLWMMYRSGWGTKPGQEVTLAIRLKREAFDNILARAIPSTYWSEVYSSETHWQEAVTQSDVRLQWDPDHHPSGAPLARRAIQLGLRGQTLKSYSRDWIIDIEDISEFVAQQQQIVKSGALSLLETPSERVYPVFDPQIAPQIGLPHE